MTGTYARALAASRSFLLEEDVDCIQGLVRVLDSRSPLYVVDLGAGSGTTALAVLDERPDARIVTVDIDPTALHWAGRAVHNAYPEAVWRMAEASAEDVAAIRFPHDDPVHLLLHDASHERDQVERDLRAWCAFLPANTPIWVHDYSSPPAAWGQPASPGVAEAVDLLVAEGLLAPRGVAGLGWFGVRA